MAAAGIGSRRACEELISEGRVAVNGQIMTELPILVDPQTDLIAVDGHPMSRYIPREARDEKSASGTRRIYVMLYKPRQTLSTSSDPDGRRTVTEVVQHPSRARLYPVGRLDYDTMGLVLLTNDGELANRLTHPRYGVEKTYRAIVKGRITQEAREKLGIGVYLSDRREGQTTGASRTRGVSYTIVKEEDARTILDLTLKEGRNRQVRRMLAQLGNPVRKLVRIAMGPVTLRGLKPGEWRDLTGEELIALRRAAAGKGPKGAAARTLQRSHAMKLGETRALVTREPADADEREVRPETKSRRGPSPAPRQRGAPAPERSRRSRTDAQAPAGQKQQPPRPKPSKPKPAPQRSRGSSSFPLAEPPPRLRT